MLYGVFRSQRNELHYKIPKLQFPLMLPLSGAERFCSGPEVPRWEVARRVYKAARSGCLLPPQGFGELGWALPRPPPPARARCLSPAVRGPQVIPISPAVLNLSGTKDRCLCASPTPDGLSGSWGVDAGSGERLQVRRTLC